MKGTSVRGLWREAELPARLRINQHGHEKENLPVMLDWYYRPARLYEASPLCPESFSSSPVPPLLSSHFLLETPDGLVHLFPLLFTECSGRKMKFMVIGLCQAGQGALFPSGCSLSLFLSHSISIFLYPPLSLSLSLFPPDTLCLFSSLSFSLSFQNFYNLRD